jgi:hypothetical protein
MRSVPGGVWWVELSGRMKGNVLEVEPGDFRGAVGRSRGTMRDVEARVGVAAKTPSQAASERRRLLDKLEQEGRANRLSVASGGKR